MKYFVLAHPHPTNMMTQRLLPVLLVLPILAFADGAADNKPESVRRIPPAGVPVPDDVRRSEEHTSELQSQ